MMTPSGDIVMTVINVLESMEPLYDEQLEMFTIQQILSSERDIRHKVI